ncbi:MAG: bifunctional riboflavin kinase/FAD synthetase [Polyangiaceae bacterium]
MSVERVDGTGAMLPSSRPSLVVIGNFDGVHRGHQAVLASARERAAAAGLRPVVLTFDPHPSVVLGKAPSSVLTTMARRVELLARALPDLTVVVQPFTRELAAHTARAFVESLLIRDLGARVVIVGKNFCFGAGRSGDVDTLAQLGAELGFQAIAHELAGDADGSYSSSRIRGHVVSGEVELAEALLGRPHATTGRVVHGDHRGRTIGVPTANLEAVAELVPKNGVYAALVDRVATDGAAEVLGRAVVNVGVRPTVAAGPSLEAHVLDFQGDLYDATLRLHFVARLRDEQKFSGLDSLVEQIRKDVEKGRELLASRSAEPAAGGAWH